MKKNYILLGLALLGLVACEQATGPGTPSAEHDFQPLSNLTSSANLGGSNTTPVSVDGCANGTNQDVTLTFSVSGRQANPASFKVNTQWVYNAGTWTSSAPSEINVPAQNAQTTTSFVRVVTLKTGSVNASGSSQAVVTPFDVSTSAPAALNVTGGSSAVHIAFAACTPAPPPNTHPA